MSARTPGRSFGRGSSALRWPGRTRRGRSSRSITRPRQSKDRALDDVLQFPDVAGVIVLEQGVPGGRGQAGDVAPVLRGELPQEVIQEQRMSLAPLPQRRDLDGDDIEAVIEIVPELPSRIARSRSRCVAASTRTSTVSVRFPRTRSNWPFLQDPQSFTWRGRREVPDLVEEDRAAVGLLEAALPLRDQRR